MTDDPTEARSRSLLGPTMNAERRIASAMLARDGAQLLAIAAELDAVAAHGDVGTGCDVAMMMMSTAAQVLGNAKTTLAQKRAWADSDGEFVAERIATFVASCEDDAGVPRSRRSLTAHLLKSF